MKKKDTKYEVVIQSLQKQANPIVKRLTDLKVKTEADYQTGAELLSKLKDLRKRGEHEQQLFTIPLNQLLKTTREHFKPFFDVVERTETEVKGEMKKFLDNMETKKLKVAEDLENGKIKKVSTFMAKTDALNVTSAHAVARTVKVLHCVNEKATPREYLVPNETKIREALKAGKKVAGWELKEEKSIAI